ncbi:MAG: hypothetical protein IJ706_04855 [Clostridia bacterium]|nr:hypothetical protein [Clostridia bacterium]
MRNCLFYMGNSLFERFFRSLRSVRMTIKGKDGMTIRGGFIKIVYSIWAIPFSRDSSARCARSE